MAQRIASVIADALLVLLGIIIGMVLMRSCNPVKDPQPSVRYVIGEHTSKADPAPVPVTTTKAHHYDFQRHDTLATITGTIISPCPPDTVLVGYSFSDQCTTQQIIHLPDTTRRQLPIQLQLWAGYQSAAVGITYPVSSSSSIGASYDIFNRSVFINYSLTIGRKSIKH